MEFEWDDRKALINAVKHGITFGDACTIFEGPVHVLPSSHVGEAREVCIGLVDGAYVAVVITHRGDTIRVISARRARDYERRAHQAVYS